jgi:hypothetical protein
MCTSIVAGGCWNTRSLVSVSVLSNTTSVTGEWQMAGSLGLMVMYGWLLEHRFSSASGVVVGCWNWNTGTVSQYRTPHCGDNDDGCSGGSHSNSLV